MLKNINHSQFFFRLHRVLRHGVFKQFCSKSSICSQTGHVYHCYGHTFCSQMINLVTNTPKQSQLNKFKENQSFTKLYFSLHRVVTHGVFKQFCLKSNICSQTGHVYHCFCPNSCSEMISLVTNTSKQFWLSNVRHIQSFKKRYFSLHRVLRHGVFKQFQKSNICS